MSSVKSIKQGPYIKYAVMVVVTMVCAAGTFMLSHSEQSTGKQFLSEFAQMRALSNQLSTQAEGMVLGEKDSFAKVKKLRSQYSGIWQKYQGSARMQYVESLDQGRANLGGMQTAWSNLEDSVRRVSGKQGAVSDLNRLSSSIQTVLVKIEEQYRNIVAVISQGSADKSLVVVAERQELLAGQMRARLDELFLLDRDAKLVMERFEREIKSFAIWLNAMRRGDAERGVAALQNLSARQQLERIADDFKVVYSSVQKIEQGIGELELVKGAVNTVIDSGSELYSLSSVLINSVSGQSSGGLMFYVTVGLGGTSVVFLMLMIMSVNRQASGLISAESEMRSEVENSNHRNQQAILRLLDELGDLADGDLTVETTVTEDFTGAIADSINFTIDQLRSLVSTINETAVKVTSAAQETQDTAKNLSEASDHQAQEIAGASAAISQMAMSIDQVSANALESASVAERSVEIANKGGDVVRATIKGMDTIREQIQETTKRIKRLGESSQEIGGIVSLINDIADQTNILALNAAIQASMAGDAGRGFAVVADEVQRLAERASAATKQIGALVKTIQNDTNEAVISMEQTTTQVVNGARLAQDAGVALGEIETVSKGLADLIQNISNAARQQAASAGQISKTMNVVQQITSQTSAGTTATSNSIGHLAELAVQMRNSVAGFKLPAA